MVELGSVSTALKKPKFKSQLFKRLVAWDGVGRLSRPFRPFPMFTTDISGRRRGHHRLAVLLSDLRGL